MFRALASLFLLASCAAAAAARIEVDVPQKSGGIVSPKVAVFDLWPESCSSQVESVVVEDRDIVLRAALSAAGCNDRALSGNEAESRLDFSLPLLWAGTYRGALRGSSSPRGRPRTAWVSPCRLRRGQRRRTAAGSRALVA
ncbi:MAG: hypothetical protein LKM39_07365 [Chiayiivirga sp.]|jgi:hypothetical protein|nr:hypothetical protein [Chiayiivirga sp.]